MDALRAEMQNLFPFLLKNLVSDGNLFEHLLRKEKELLIENLREMSGETKGMTDTIVTRGVKEMVGHIKQIEPTRETKIQQRRTGVISIAPAMIVTTAVGETVGIDTMCVC